MNVFKNILSIILVLAVVNIFTAKAIHEFFEHHEETHACKDKSITHFHENELQHLDLICDFNISTTLLTDFSCEFKNKNLFFSNTVRVKFIQLIQNLFHYHFLLRGPPVIK